VQTSRVDLFEAALISFVSFQQWRIFHASKTKGVFNRLRISSGNGQTQHGQKATFENRQNLQTFRNQGVIWGSSGNTKKEKKLGSLRLMDNDPSLSLTCFLFGIAGFVQGGYYLAVVAREWKIRKLISRYLSKSFAM
jgi:hypothetical protein